MKKYFKYSVFLLAGFILLQTSCQKEVGPNHLPKLPELTRTPVPLFTPDTSLDAVIQKPDEFHAAFTIDLYFPDDVQPASCDIDIAMNGDYTNIKKLKTGITTFPTKVDVTGADIAQAFGIDVNDIKPGDYFELRATYTLKDGTVLNGFANGTDAIDASSDIKNFPGAQTAITYTAVCPFEISAFLGQKSVEDPFWGVNYDVTVTEPSPNVLQVAIPAGIYDDNGANILIHINPKTFEATVASVFAPVFGAYTNLTMTGSGQVDACNNVITLGVAWTVDQGSYGTGTFVLKQ